MKRISALLLATLTLLFPFFSSNASGENISCEPIVLNIFDYSASEWLNTYTNRAMFAVAACCDVMIAEPNSDRINNIISEALVDDAIFIVSITDLGLNAAFLGDNETLMITYIPLLETLEYTFLDFSGKYAFINSVEEEQMTYYSIDPDDFLELLQMVSDAIE